MTDQIFHPYTAWEDWQAGMWQPSTDVAADMQRAAHILSSPSVFLAAARAMLRDWPNAAEHNLTDLGQNRRSWVGQASCMHLASVPEEATRLAWWTLSPAEQVAANQTADQAVTEWELERANRDTPGLFALPEASRA